MSWRRVAFGLALGATFGFAVFFVLAWNATSVERVTADEAGSRFEAALRPFPTSPSLLERDASGTLIRRTPPPASRPGAIDNLHVLAHRTADSRLVEVVIPFWFFRLKAPAAQLMLRGTGFDLSELGVTADDLEVHGPGVIVNETSEDGDRLLIWTR